MKNFKLFFFLLVSFVLVFSACEPIIEELQLTDTTNVDGVQLLATQSSLGGNKISLKMVTPGITGYWDYGSGKALTNEVTIIWPISGKQTFTYVGKLGLTFFTKTVDVQIDKIDTPLNPLYYSLASNNTMLGKDWVFDGVGNDGREWFFMSDPKKFADATTVLFNAGGDCCPPADVDGKMHFNFKGDSNYDYYESKTGAPVKSRFIFDIVNMRITIKGGQAIGGILGGDKGSADRVYRVVSLTPDKLVLYDEVNDEDQTGWTFVYKPL